METGGEGQMSGWSLWGIIMGLFQLLMTLVTFVKRFCGCGDDAEIDHDQDRSAISLPPSLPPSLSSSRLHV